MTSEAKQSSSSQQGQSESCQALKDLERFMLAMESTNNGIWDWNLKTNETYFSPQWKTMLGYEEEELANSYKQWEDLLHPDDLQRARSVLQAYLNGESQSYEFEQRLHHKDGSYRWILGRGSALRDERGTPYRIVGVNLDITDHKRAEEAMRQSEKRFSQAFYGSPIPIGILMLASGRFSAVNDAWLQLTGYTRAEVIEKTEIELGLWPVPEEGSNLVKELEETGCARNKERVIRTRAGQFRNVMLSAELLELNGKTNMLCFIYDITALKQTQQILEKRVEERAHELAVINEITSAIGRSLNLKEILDVALTKAMAIMRMEVGAAYSLKDTDEVDGEKQLFLEAQHGLSSKFLERVNSLKVGETAILIAADAQQPVVWQIRNHPNPEIKQALQKEGIQQVVVIPLFGKGRLMGAINLGTHQGRLVTPEEISLLASIGHQVAVAVENARLYDQAEQSAAIAERHRLSRELHDSVTQSLYSVTMYAEAAARLLDAGKTATAAEHLRELRHTAQDALREMRLLIFELRPPELSKIGLVAALQARLDSVEGRGGMQTELHVKGKHEPGPLSHSMEEELYHIAQEALNNILKHANAKHVRIRLYFSQLKVSLSICDDGIGFLPTQSDNGGLGLASLKERAEKIGASLEIKSTPGRGTKINVVVPSPTVRELNSNH